MEKLADLLELLFGVKTVTQKRKDGNTHHVMYRQSNKTRMSYDTKGHGSGGDYLSGSGHTGGKGRRNKYWEKRGKH